MYVAKNAFLMLFYQNWPPTRVNSRNWPVGPFAPSFVVCQLPGREQRMGQYCQSGQYPDPRVFIAGAMRTRDSCPCHLFAPADDLRHSTRYRPRHLLSLAYNYVASYCTNMTVQTRYDRLATFFDILASGDRGRYQYARTIINSDTFSVDTQLTNDSTDEVIQQYDDSESESLDQAATLVEDVGRDGGPVLDSAETPTVGIKKKFTFKILIHELYGMDAFLSMVKDRKSTRLNSSHSGESRMPSSA